MAETRSRCSEAREALSARLDGEATGMGKETLERHLAGCVGCRRFAAAIDTLTVELRSSRAETAPQLAPAILARIDAERRARRAGAAVRAAAVVLALASVPLGTLAATARPVVAPTHAATPCTAGLHTPRLTGLHRRG